MRSIPAVTKNLLIINVLMFLASLVAERQGIDLNDMLGLHYFQSPDFHLFQFVSYMFMHGGWDHIFFNMFALWMFGCVVERVWGGRRFLFYYLFCGIGAGLTQELVQWGTLQAFPDMMMEVGLVGGGSTSIPFAQYLLHVSTTVGASGAIYAILLAFGMIFPEERIFIFPLPVPIKAKWFVCIYAAIELFLAISQNGDGVAHVAHLGGMLFGYLLIRYWQRHPGSADFGRGRQFFENMQRNWERRSNKNADHPMRNRNEGASDYNSTRRSDWDYNAQKKATQEEVDRILDKIRRSGYDSLTDAEKRKLFDSSEKM